MLANADITINQSELHFGLLNIPSLSDKEPVLQDVIKDRKYDFFCLKETWQQVNNFPQLNDVTLPGFAGGGLTMIYRNNFKSHLSLFQLTTHLNLWP